MLCIFPVHGCTVLVTGILHSAEGKIRFPVCKGLLEDSGMTGQKEPALMKAGLTSRLEALTYNMSIIAGLWPEDRGSAASSMKCMQPDKSAYWWLTAWCIKMLQHPIESDSNTLSTWAGGGLPECPQ